MLIKDINDPASHCLGLIHPCLSTYEYGNPHSNRLASAETLSASLDPPKDVYDYEGALNYLFNESQENPAAKKLCSEIGLMPAPPIEAGVLLYLLRMESIGRIAEWPLLFGTDNSFILYMLNKMDGENFAADSETERSVWEMRRAETAEWLKQRTVRTSR
ncbi:hypothetical protein BGZ74_009737 [Mortierella antarctica]|nr:hypothetical protein BGZ74_009737 [Mortierella antarctica]